MAISIQSLLPQLRPPSHTQLDLSGLRDALQPSKERERLRLMREEFEYKKKQDAETAKLERYKVNAETTRARMKGDQEAAAAQALAAAELTKTKQGYYQKFTELVGDGKGIQQAEAMVGQMDAVGMGVDKLGEVDGLPVYRVVMDKAADAAEQAGLEADALPSSPLDPNFDDDYDRDPAAPVRAARPANESVLRSLDRMSALGYPMDERGNLDDPQDPERSTPTGEVTVNTKLDGSVDPAVEDALTPGEGDYRYEPTPEEPPPAGAYGSMEEGVGAALPEAPLEEVTLQPGGLRPAQLGRGDAYAQALQASEYARRTGMARRGPDPEDTTGGVQKNVIDTGAMVQQTRARLDPLMTGLASAMPDEASRLIAERTGKALRGSGLSLPDQLAAYQSAINDPLGRLNANTAADAAMGKFRETRDEASPKDISMYGEKGRDSAETLAVKNKIPEAVTGLDLADQITDMLDDPIGGNDTMIGGALIQMQAVKGDPSDRELQSVFGESKTGIIDEVFKFIEEKSKTGFSTLQREAIRSYVNRTAERLRGKVYGYLDTSDGLGGSYNDYEKTGFVERANQIVPEHWRAQREEDRAERKKKGGGKAAPAAPSNTAPGNTPDNKGQKAPPGAAGAELQRQAEEAGLNVGVLGQLVTGESEGDTSAASDKSSAKGIFQLIDKTAQGFGYADAAAYAAEPLDKQIEVGLKLFTGKGLTAESPREDYALVLAAPSKVGKWQSRDDVVYAKDSDEWKVNRPWRPSDGGDITVGSISDYYFGKSDKGAEPPAPTEPMKAAAEQKPTESNSLPEPKTPEEKRIAELLRKRG